MKKIILLCLFVSSITCFGAKIGTNSIGFGLGMLEYGADVTEAGVNTEIEFDGFAFSIGGNLNILPLENSSFGLDTSFSFVHGTELGPHAGLEADVTSLSLLLRPYTKLGDALLFADLGIGYTEIEVYGTGTGYGEDTAFAAGFGAEFEISKLILQPALTWVFVGDDTYSTGYDLSEQLQLSIPVSFPINEKVDLTFNYNHTFAEKYTFGTTTIEPYIQFFSLGLDYNY